MKNRFLEAVAFAKKMFAELVTKELYNPGLESKFTSAYTNAFNLHYVFKASKRNDFVKGSTMQITVKDRAGNVVMREIDV